MEDLAFLCEAMGFSTGIDISKLLEVRAFAAIQLPDERMPGAIARAGLPKDFTFHESGSYAS
jgi:hydroxymethylglutaryl-CoA lyase